MDKFIDMASMDEYKSYKNGEPDDNNIFKRTNKVSFKDYEHIEGLNIGQLWTNYSNLIVNRIKEKIELLSQKETLTQKEELELEKLNKASKAIEEYSFVNEQNVDQRIDKFIEMASMDEYTSYKNGELDDNNIFKRTNKVPYKNYEHINGLYVSKLFHKYADRIIERIEGKLNMLSQKKILTKEEKEELDKLNKATKAISDYNFYNQNRVDLKIDKFIEMLSMPEYTSYKDGWPDAKNIFKVSNKVPFKDYEHIDGLNTSSFFSKNTDRIVAVIKEQQELLLKKEKITIEEKEELEKLKKAAKAISDYNFYNPINLNLRIEKYIEMLSENKYTSYKDGKPDNNNIFSQPNKVPFKDYEHIDGLNTSGYWTRSGEEIERIIKERIHNLQEKEKLNQEEEQQLEKLNKATKAIADYIFSNPNNIDLRVDKFIEMASMDEYTSYKDGKPDENNIFKYDNKVPYKDYEHIDGLYVSKFSYKNADKIIERIKGKLNILSQKEILTEEEKEELEKLNKATKAIADYNFVNPKNVELKIDKFIEMLSMDEYTRYKNGQPDETNIFSQNNKVPFKGYEHIKGLDTSHFWDDNSDIIEQHVKDKIRIIAEKKDLTAEELKELKKLRGISEKINDYKFVNRSNIASKIDKFIEMLSMPEYTSYKDGKPDEKNILKGSNKVQFKDYEHIDGLNTSGFSKNIDRIVAVIKEQQELLLKKEKITIEEKEELEKLKKAAKAISDYNFYNPINLNLRIEKYIEMLSENKYTSYKDGKPDNNNIFSQPNKVPFKDYEHIDGLNTSGYWTRSGEEIERIIKERIHNLQEKEKLTQEEEKQLEKLKKATKAIADYNFVNPKNVELKIDKFIEMASMEEYTRYKNGQPDDKNIFGQHNKLSFKGYEHIDGLYILNFYYKYADIIIQRIKEKNEMLSRKEKLTTEEKDELEKLKRATKAIADYNFTNRLNLDIKIDKFIEMLGMDEYTGYEDGKPNKNNIFKLENKVSFKDYEHITGLNTANFWAYNATKFIIPKLFFLNEYADSKYNVARKNVMTYLNYLRRRSKQPEFNNIYEYIETLDKTKKEVQSLIKLRDELLYKENELIISNNELRNKTISNSRAV